MKALIMARVSTKEQEESGESIPAQLHKIKEYALSKNLVIINIYQITESSSKETRKQFDEVLSKIKKSKEPVALVVDTIDRLQRSFRESVLLDSLRKKSILSEKTSL